MLRGPSGEREPSIFDDAQRVVNAEGRRDVALGQVERVHGRAAPITPASSLPCPAARYRSMSAATAGTTSSFSPCRAASSIISRRSFRAMDSSKLAGVNFPSDIDLPRPPIELPGLNWEKRV